MDRTKRNRRSGLVGAVALAGAAIVITGCGSSSSSTSQGTGSGSSFAAVANQTWCKAAGLCTYISKGSGGGITDFTNGVVNPLAFNAAFNASSSGTSNLVHVLQAPVIVTAHNKPAEVTVGQQYPIINGGQSTLARVLSDGGQKADLSGLPEPTARQLVRLLTAKGWCRRRGRYCWPRRCGSPG